MEQKIKITPKLLAKRWFIDAFSGMALGLFATLIAGTILEQIGNLIGNNKVGLLLIQIGKIAKILMGAGIGAGIAYVLKADKLTIFSCLVAGMVGANASGFNSIVAGIGNPIGAYLTALISCEICMLFSGKTKIDIILVPLGAMLITAVVVITLCPPVKWFVAKLAEWIAVSMQWSPFFMGIVIAVSMGLLLTMPTSSAAIWVAIATTSNSPEIMLAGGAAAVGCAAQMIGFGVASFKENKFSGLIAQGLGTSMLQIPNIMRNPKILIPATVASAVVGPMATVLFKLQCNAAGGGMGTAGLVGVFGTIASSQGKINSVTMWIGIVLLFFILPAIIAFGVDKLCRKIGWIKDGDYKLEL